MATSNELMTGEKIARKGREMKTKMGSFVGSYKHLWSFKTLPSVPGSIDSDDDTSKSDVTMEIDSGKNYESVVEEVRQAMFLETPKKSKSQQLK